jgi:hypothetical protein
VPILYAVITAVMTAAFLHWLNVPATVRAHDELVRNRDEDLLTWVQDDDRRLEGEIEEKVARVAAAGAGLGGAPIQVREKLTAQAEHSYRDQRRAAQRAVREARQREGVAHRLYRRLSGNPFPSLTAPDQVADITDRWRRREPPQAGLRAA